MKKKILFVVLVFIASISFAQQIQPTDILIGSDTKQSITAQKHLNDLSQIPIQSKVLDLSGSKTLQWKFDTIICYDTSLNIIGRYTQTFDNNGNILVRISDNFQGGVWVNCGRWTNTYDGSGNLLTSIGEFWQSGSWNNDMRYSYTYDINGNQLTELSELWAGSSWSNYEKHTYTYDLIGNLLTGLWEQWQSGAWENFQRYTNTFDAYNNLLTSIGEKWQSGAWTNSGKTTYTYDLNGNVLIQLSEYWQSGAWTNGLKYTNNYDFNNNLLVSFGEQWNGSSWKNYSKDSNIYDINGYKLLRIFQGTQLDPFSGNWNFVNSARNTYTNDINGNMLTDYSEIWQSGAWLNHWKYYYSYDANGNSVTGKREIWQNSSWHHDLTYNLWIYSGKVPVFQVGGFTCYQYNSSYKSVITGIANTNTVNYCLNIFPNPASETVTLNIDKKDNSDLTINIYNVNGTLVRSEMLKQNMRQINTGDLRNGIYLVEIITKGWTEKQKLIIQR